MNEWEPEPTKTISEIYLDCFRNSTSCKASKLERLHNNNLFHSIILAFDNSNLDLVYFCSGLIYKLVIFYISELFHLDGKFVEKNIDSSL